MKIVSLLPTVFLEEPSWERGRISRGELYRVVVSFADADADQHHVGEQWTYIGSLFSKFDNDVTLFVSGSDGANFQFPLHWTPDTQEHVIENILTYICRVQG
jgi:hypothetical protein